MRDKGDRKKSKKAPHPPWWKNPWNRWEVYHGNECSYLIHFPKWGSPILVHWCPRSFGLRDPLDFATTFGTEVFEMLKKPAKGSDGASRFAAPTDDIARIYPTLAEYLTATAYEGDAPGTRATSTLLIFAQEGTWRAVLRDRQEARCLWVTASSFDDILGVLENTLTDPNAVWRDDRLSGAEQAKRQNHKKGT